MGKNTGKSFRLGAVIDRSQVLNPKTNQYVKRDATTGQFIAAKATQFKGVKLENNNNNNNNNNNKNKK